MENNKKKMHPFFKILIILFFTFLCFYVALESGYYPSKVRKNAILTNNEINKFENDLDNNKVINKNGYIENNVDYSNTITKVGNTLTKSMGKLIEKSTNGVSYVFKTLFS